MLIRYKAAAEDEWIVLCGDGLTTGAHEALRINEAQVTDRSTAFRAATTTTRGRAGWAIALSFTVQRAFSDAAEAETFARRHRAELPDTGVLFLGYDASDSDPDFVPDATFVALDRRVEGCNVVLTYSFTGGAFSDTDPFAP